jgi:anti-sigma factor RsiW
MSDCTNIEVRELLPDYLHGRLGGTERERVEAHLAGCAECSGELALLRSVRQAYAHAPAMDVAAIARALPRPRRVAARPPLGRPMLLRIAAVVSFIALGGISLATVRSVLDGGGRVIDTLQVLDRGSDTGAGSNDSAGSRVAPAISFGGGVSDLATEDLAALLAALESLEAVPSLEPEDLLLGDAGRGGS